MSQKGNVRVLRSEPGKQECRNLLVECSTLAVRVGHPDRSEIWKGSGSVPVLSQTWEQHVQDTSPSPRTETPRVEGK